MKTVKTRTAFSRAHISGKAVDTIKFSLFLSLCFNGHFSGWTWVSRFYWSKGRWKWWWQLKL